MTPDYVAIGLRLKEVRNLKKITQRELADYIGVSVSYVKNIERGGKPSIEYLLAVADKCATSIDWLLTGVLGKHDEPSNIQSQKIEAVFDPDLKRMMDILRGIMESDNPHMRSWAIIQFEAAFREHCATEEKKHA